MASWENFLDENKELVDSIFTHLKEETRNGIEITPPKELRLRFTSRQLSSVKILILGQDPYPQSGVATGRAFEVGTLHSWFDSFRNTSLKNIVRAIYAAGNDRILKFNEILQEIKAGNFKILAPNELFAALEAQGVLFLNTAFSCRVGEPGSHIKLWEPFTAKLLSFISKENPEILWFIWGSIAEKQTQNLSIKKLVSSHPMICCNKPKDFLFDVNMFKQTKDLICWTGIHDQCIND